ncbi:MAG: hypothetical protein ABL955_14075, partial [Elusimicrobiota bacterium]
VTERYCWVADSRMAPSTGPNQCAVPPIKDIASEPDPESAPPRPRKGGDVRVETLARENEALRAKIDNLAGLVAEFERRLSGAASAYEGAALESDSARRMVMLDNARLTGELDSARA